MYKYSGDYSYRRAMGDYMRGRGDPFLGFALKLGAGIVKKVAPKVVSTIGKAVGLIKKAPVPVQIAAGAGATALGGAIVTKTAENISKVPGFFSSNGRKRRSMNALNPKALARATRRLEGFRTKSTKALRELGFNVTRKAGAGSRACSCGKKKCSC